MTHGHLADVRFGVTTLPDFAQQADASIAVFGHTHQIACEKVGHRPILNQAVFLNRGTYSNQKFCYHRKY